MRIRRHGVMDADGARRTQHHYRYPKPSYGPQAQADLDRDRHQRDRRAAARVVACHAHDDTDRALLLSVLDLDEVVA